MGDKERIEDRFHAAALKVCNAWECFDFDQQYAGRTRPLVLAEYLKDVPRRDDHPIQILRERIQTLGGAEALRYFLRCDLLSDFTLELSAHNRLDLALEALCVRPAWLNLFREDERLTAAKRLSDALLFASSGALSPPAGSDLDSTVDWLNEQLIRWERDISLSRFADLEELGWCESVAESARELEEVGRFRTSLEQCNHYHSCAPCAARWPYLDRFIRKFETKTFDMCRHVLKVLTACMDRVRVSRTAEGQRDGQAVDALAWRAIIFGAGAIQQPSVWDVFQLQNEECHPVLEQLISSLTEDEVFALSFVESASFLFKEADWSLIGNDDVIYFPSDGDVSDIPGIVAVLPAADFGDWKKLMTGSDLVFSQVRVDGESGSTSLDGQGLFMVLVWAAAFRNAHLSKSASPSGSLGFAGPKSGIEASMNELGDRMSRLYDVVESNSAAQVPVIDTLGELLRRMDGPSRYRAEESLRTALGEHVYRSLCPTARDAAIAAEYYWLDPNFPDPSKIVEDLAMAFERQLLDRVFEPFCDHLKAIHIADYPQRNGAPIDRRQTSTTMPSLPRDQEPWLLRGSKINRKLGIGEMKRLLDPPLEALRSFLNKRGLNAGKIASVLSEVTPKRNEAVHQRRPQSRAGADDIRLCWLHGNDRNQSIFGALLQDTDPKRTVQ